MARDYAADILDPLARDVVNNVGVWVEKEVRPNASEFEHADAFPEPLLKGMSDATGGKLYFFPTNWNNVVVFYNKDLFDAAGIPYPKKSWTWSEFLDAAQKLTKRDASGQVTQYGMRPHARARASTLSAARTMGISIMRPSYSNTPVPAA